MNARYAVVRDVGGARLLLAAIGLAFLAVGVWQFVAHVPTTVWLRVGIWVAAGIPVHDGVLAPLGVASGWFVKRRAPERAQPVLRSIGLLVLTLALLTGPLLATGGLRH